MHKTHVVKTVRHIKGGNYARTHLYFNGRCQEAIAQYVKAFGAEVKDVIPYPEEEHKKGVLHSEIFIHGQRVMMNDEAFGHPDMVVIFQSR